METTDRLCVHCESNPAEPNLPCCDNTFCREAELEERGVARRVLV